MKWLIARFKAWKGRYESWKGRDLPWHSSTDENNCMIMRRRVNGEWQSRAATEEEIHAYYDYLSAP